MSNVCGDCEYFFDTGLPYNDCRESSPKVVVPTMERKMEQVEGKPVEKFVGKMMTVWPRVGRKEAACGRFKRK